MFCYLLVVICIIEFVKKNYFRSLMIFFFLLLDGFQVLPLGFLTWGFFSGASSDAALLAFLAIFIIRSPNWFNKRIKNNKVGKAILLFTYFLLANILYGLIVKRYAFVDVFRGGRNYLFLLSFFMFLEVPLNVIMKVVKVLTFITFIQSILYILQIITGQPILAGGDKNYLMQDLDYTRFYNTPKLLNFALMVCLFWFPFGSFLKKYRLLFIGVIMLAFFGPLHRGYIISFFLAIMLYALLFNSYIKKVFYISFVGGFAIAISTIDIVRKRFSGVIEQMSFLSDIYSNKAIEASNNFSYRINHLMERIIYINTHSFGWLFGIGVLDDKAPEAINLPFQYGIADPISGAIQKIYTPDIVWSLLFLTLGYVGTILYLNVYAKILWDYSRNSVSIEISKVIFVLILLEFFTTFTSSSLIEPDFFMPILILVVIIEKREEILIHAREMSIISDKR